MTCEADHPDKPGLTCTMPGVIHDHPMHSCWTREGTLTWPNPRYVEPVRRGRGRSKVKALADEARRKVLEDRTKQARVPVDANAAPVGRNHPETAKEAARGAFPQSGSKRRMAYDLIRQSGGLTAEEVGLHFGWQHQSYSSAVSTLYSHGWLEPSGEKRLTLSGEQATVWVVVED